MNENTDWISAGAILAAGLILGSMFVYFFARRRPSSIAGSPLLDDLEAKREALIQQLREELPDDERTSLELETAKVLRSIDEEKMRGRSPLASPRQMSPEIRKATLAGFAWGAGSMLAVGVLGYFVVEAAKPREDGATQAMQQQRPGQPSAQPPSTDPVVLQLEAAVKSRPDDLKLRLDLAQSYLERENLMGVFQQTEYVLGKSPDDSRALTYQALVRMAMGQTAEAGTMLQRATRLDPELLDAWVALAWVRTQEGKAAEADAAMQEAMRRRPDEKQRLEQVLAQMKSHEKMNMKASLAAPAVRDAKTITVTLDLDPSAKSRRGVIFVVARAAGVTAGPPIAAKRLQLDSLPYTFELGAADSMMGQALPETVRLDARLDSDGNAATRDPSDPVASQDGVKLGSSVRITLK